MPSPSPSRASADFAAWTDEIGVCVAAQILGVDPGYISKMRKGRRIPSLRLAARIERATATWCKPIMAVAWVPVTRSTRPRRPPPQPSSEVEAA